MRRIPPIAVPFGPTPVVRALAGSGASGEPAFAAELVRRSGARRVHLFGSGRAALAAALGPLRSDDRDEVLVPAYTCWTVAASVVRARMRVRLADVDPLTLDYDPSSLEAGRTGRLAAALAAHLFARTSDVAALVRFFADREPGVRVIEDAAQAWPDREPRGAVAAILSFGRGKPLPLGGGGALLRFEDDPEPDRATRTGGLGRALSLMATATLGRPSLFGLLEPLPFLGIGTTVYDPGFGIDVPFHAWQERLGVRLLVEHEAFRASRERHALALAERVEATRGWSLPAGPRLLGPLRLPALAPSRMARDGTIERLREMGVVASPMYPGTLADIPALRAHLANADEPLPGARALADRLLTLPCYPGLAPRDLARLLESFQRAAATFRA